MKPYCKVFPKLHDQSLFASSFQAFKHDRLDQNLYKIMRNMVKCVQAWLTVHEPFNNTIEHECVITEVPSSSLKLIKVKYCGGKRKKSSEGNGEKRDR